MTWSASIVDAPRRLNDVVCVDGYGARALHVISQIQGQTDLVGVLELFIQAKSELGVEHAVFVSALRDRNGHGALRFMAATDAVWGLDYQQQHCYANDAWLDYSATCVEPVPDTAIPLRTRSQREARDLSARYGTVSAYIVPVPTSNGLSRVGMLALGSGRVNFFDNPASVGMLRILAHGLAMELHGWLLEDMRQRMLRRHRMAPQELELLRMEWRGLSTKHIAAELGCSATSIDSRFQRINAKLETPNRKASARYAAEYALI